MNSSPANLKITADKVIEFSRETERLISKYLIIGSLGSIAFVITFLSKALNNKNIVEKIELPITFFSIAFIIASIHLVCVSVISKKIALSLMEVIPLQEKVERGELSQTEFLEISSRKEFGKRITKLSKYGSVLFYVLVWLGGGSYIVGLFVSVFSIVELN